MHISGLFCCSDASSLVLCLTNCSCLKRSKLKSLLPECDNTAVHWSLIPCATVNFLASRNLGKWRDHLIRFPSLKDHSPGLSIAQWLQTVDLCISFNFIICYSMRINPMPIVLSWMKLEFPCVIRLCSLNTHLMT